MFNDTILNVYFMGIRRSVGNTIYYTLGRTNILFSIVRYFNFLNYLYKNNVVRLYQSKRELGKRRIKLIFKFCRFKIFTKI